MREEEEEEEEQRDAEGTDDRQNPACNQNDPRHISPSSAQEAQMLEQAMPATPAQVANILATEPRTATELLYMEQVKLFQDQIDAAYQSPDHLPDTTQASDRSQSPGPLIMIGLTR